MAELRRRPRLPGEAPDESETDGRRPPPLRGHPAMLEEHADVPVWMSIMGLAALVALALFAAWLVHSDTAKHNEGTLFTPEELAKYDGRQSNAVYLAIMGRVFDVTPGHKHYGVHGGYGFFSAKDASRAYVTGKFKEDLTDDVADFTAEQFEELVGWRQFYVSHQKYRPVGRVVGRFYDADGQPTALLATAEAQAAAAAAAKEAVKAGAKDAAAAVLGASRPCSVRWSKKEGGWVYCPAPAEAEAQRYPRRVAVPDERSGRMDERCACFEGTEHSAARRLYDGCAPDAPRCMTSQPEPEW